MRQVNIFCSSTANESQKDRDSKTVPAHSGRRSNTTSSGLKQLYLSALEPQRPYKPGTFRPDFDHTYSFQQDHRENNEKPVTAQVVKNAEPDCSSKHSLPSSELEQLHINLSITNHEIIVSIPEGIALPLTLSIRSTQPLRIRTERSLEKPETQREEDSKSTMTSRISPRSEENQPLNMVNSSNNSLTSTQVKKTPSTRQVRGGQILISNSLVPQPRSEEVVVEGHVYSPACSNIVPLDEPLTAESQPSEEEIQQQPEPTDEEHQAMTVDNHPAAKPASVQLQPEKSETEQMEEHVAATEPRDTNPVNPISDPSVATAQSDQPQAESSTQAEPPTQAEPSTQAKPSTKVEQTLDPSTVPKIHVERASDSGPATPLQRPSVLAPVQINADNAAASSSEAPKISPPAGHTTTTDLIPSRPTMVPIRKHHKAVRRARSLILKRPILATLLGRQLADLTGPQLKALAAGGTLLATTAVPTIASSHIPSQSFPDTTRSIPPNNRSPAAISGYDGPAEDRLDQQNASCAHNSWFHWRYNWTVKRANKALLRRCSLCNGVSQLPVYRLNKMTVKRKHPGWNRHKRHNEATQLTEGEKFCWRSRAFGVTCDGNNDEKGRRRYLMEGAQRRGLFTERRYLDGATTAAD